MEDNLYKFSANLIAYLYQNYESAKLVNDLPIRMEYEIPETFNRRIGDIQIQVNGTLRKDLKVAYEKTFWRACQSRSTFRAYIMRVCRRLSKHFQLQIYYLGILAIASELNLFCFQQGCYRYAFYMPECIRGLLESTVLKTFPANNDEERERISEKFEEFLNSCEDILEPANEDFYSNHQTILQFSNYISNEEITRYELKNRMFELPLGDVQEESDSSMHSEEGLEEDAESDTSSGEEAKCEGSSSKEDPFAQEDMEANLLAAAAKPVNCNACRVCHEENCKRYLEKFVRKYAAGEMKYDPKAVP